MTTIKLILIGLAFTGSVSLAQAQYVLNLKNGRQITVQSYREEGTSIKFTGLGGEIAIAKDQIQSIEKAGQSQRPGVNLPELEASSRQSPAIPQKPPPTPTRSPAPQVREQPPLASAMEEKEYQKRLAEVTQKLEVAQQEYLNATQGGANSSNVGNQGWQGVAADIGSRIRDSQKVPGGGPPAGTPPMQGYEAPTYTPQEKEVSDVRSRIADLQKERNSLIEEMKSKNIPAP
jgi:hypothetical protein